MNDASITLALYRIFTGTLFFTYNSEQYELRSPEIATKYQAELLYNNIVNEEKFHNWIREENLINIMISLGVWHQNTNSLLEQLDKKIDNLKVELYQNRIKSKEVDRIRKKIITTQKEIDNISSTKHGFFSNTLEGYAESIKNEYIICSTLYKNNKKVFLNNNKDSTSYTQFNNIISEINKYILTIKDYKSIARSQLWKSYWNSGDKNNMFCKYSIDLTDEQRSLLNISRMYDSIYEHPECPESSVISDDDMLDGWMILQRKNAEKTKKQKSLGNDKISNAGEVFVVTDNVEDIENIVDLNTDENKAILMEKLRYINSQKESQIEDFNLPDVQRDLLNQSRQLRKQ